MSVVPDRKVDMPIDRKVGLFFGPVASVVRMILVVCAVACAFFAEVGFRLRMVGQSVRNSGARAYLFADEQLRLAGKEFFPFLSYFYFYRNDKAKLEAAAEADDGGYRVNGESTVALATSAPGAATAGRNSVSGAAAGDTSMDSHRRRRSTGDIAAVLVAAPAVMAERGAAEPDADMGLDAVSNAVPGEELAAEATVVDIWACSSCTFENSLENYVCEVCGNPKLEDSGEVAAVRLAALLTLEHQLVELEGLLEGHTLEHQLVELEELLKVHSPDKNQYENIKRKAEILWETLNSEMNEIGRHKRRLGGSGGIDLTCYTAFDRIQDLLNRVTVVENFDEAERGGGGGGGGGGGDASVDDD